MKINEAIKTLFIKKKGTMKFEQNYILKKINESILKDSANVLNYLYIIYIYIENFKVYCSVNFIYVYKYRTHIFKPINKH